MPERAVTMWTAGTAVLLVVPEAVLLVPSDAALLVVPTEACAAPICFAAAT
jgi:hypothetical protein